MRGALEAAKLREEKHKSELEKLNKDLDAARREGAGLRRSEMEVCSFFCPLFAY